ncbi:MAG: hypothetical protein LBD93_08970 [Treponema sp.]|nr:hypothetical protein [Treponema sp.]
MITIEQSIPIPAERSEEEAPRTSTPEPFPRIEALKAEAAAQYAAMLETGIDPLSCFAGCLNCSEDGLDYQ